MGGGQSTPAPTGGVFTGDLLAFAGCTSARRLAADGAPFYKVAFEATDPQLYAAVAAKVGEVAAVLRTMDGPVYVLIYNERQWNTAPMPVTLLFPSLTPEGRRAPNLATLGRQHRWMAGLLRGLEADVHVCNTFPMTEVYQVDAGHAGNGALREDILPMDHNLYNACPFVLKTAGDEYVYELGKTQSHVLRRKGDSYSDLCRKWGQKRAEVRKKGRDCNRDNNMCAQEHADITAQLEADIRAAYDFHNIIPYRRPARRVRATLTAEALTAYDEIGSEVVWQWSWRELAEVTRVQPVALVLTGDGELVVYNARDQVIGTAPNAGAAAASAAVAASAERDAAFADILRSIQARTGADGDGGSARLDYRRRDGREGQNVADGEEGVGGEGGEGAARRPGGACAPPPFTFI